MPNIKEYLDFRVFLKDWYAEKKQKEAWLTHRILADKFDLKSPSHLSEVIKGRVLSADFIEKYSLMLGLSKSDDKIFRTLVDYSQCKDSKQELHIFAQLKKLGVGPLQEDLDDIARDFFADPTQVILFNLCACHPMVQDPQKLSQLARPKLPARRAKCALEFLQKAGFLKWSDAAGWVHDSSHLRFGAKRRTTILEPYYESMLELGLRMWQEDRGHQVTSMVTLSLSEENALLLKQKIRAFRQEIVQLANSDSKSERTMHVNFQLLELDDLGI